MAVLQCLVKASNSVVTRQELFDAAWRGGIVSDEALTQRIAEIRKAFGDSAHQSDIIETIPKIGFRLIPSVVPLPGEPGTVEANPVIAVLPFVNMSGDPGNEYFSDGVSEEIIHLLTRVPGLTVISRSSAFSFKEQNVDIPTIAAKLNVDHVLEGSVRKSGKQLRITAQLVEVETDAHLWSNTYDHELRDIFAIQDEIAEAVVGALKVTLLGERPTSTETDPEAYALFLKARYLTNRYTVEGFEHAETLLTQALAIDPNFAPAWTEMGYVYMLLTGRFGLLSNTEGFELARHAIHNALAIDPQYGLAYASLAWLEMLYDWDFTAARQNLQRALKLNSRDPAILLHAARLHRIDGRLAEAIDLLRQSIALDPLWAPVHFRLSQNLRYANRLDEAKESIQTVLSLSPGLIGAQLQLGLVILAQGDAPAALLAIEREQNVFWRLWGLAIVQHALGNDEASDAALQEFVECYAEGGALQVAEVYAFRGEIDLAFDWLQQAYDNRDPGITSMLVIPELTGLHDDPRWESMRDKLRLPHKRLKCLN
jgi:TolB-like protein/lipoprotein NlpI